MMDCHLSAFFSSVCFFKCIFVITYVKSSTRRGRTHDLTNNSHQRSELNIKTRKQEKRIHQSITEQNESGGGAGDNIKLRSKWYVTTRTQISEHGSNTSKWITRLRSRPAHEPQYPRCTTVELTIHVAMVELNICPRGMRLNGWSSA